MRVLLRRGALVAIGIGIAAIVGTQGASAAPVKAVVTVQTVENTGGCAPATSLSVQALFPERTKSTFTNA